MIGLLDIPKLVAVMALGMVIAGVPAYFQGRAHQRQAMAVESLESSVKTLRKKGEIDAQVSSADASALCADYGLPDDEQAECMRRIREASANSGNVGIHPAE